MLEIIFCQIIIYLILQIFISFLFFYTFKQIPNFDGW